MNVPVPDRAWERVEGEDWRPYAQCAKLPLQDSWVYISSRVTHEERRWALSLCAQCPVRAQCLAWAASEGCFEGIAGGRAWGSARRDWVPVHRKRRRGKDRERAVV